MVRLSEARLAGTAALLVLVGCRGPVDHPVLTFSGSVVGGEAGVLRRQLTRFHDRHPEVTVRIRATPDAADERHQLYVQWLNGQATDPDVLQLDLVWTPEFAAAGWILALDPFHPALERFFPSAVAANRWRGATYALPWFVDVGMLYWRTDLAKSAPRSFEELRQSAALAQSGHDVPYGLVWSGARYEGLVTVFLEYLGAYGGQIFDEDGRVAVDSEASVTALSEMRDAVSTGLVPRAALTWQEEQVRFAFQNGQAVFMRNWPYAYAALDDASGSRVTGRFAVAPMPGGRGGRRTAALGGSQLAINAFSDKPTEAYMLIEFLLQPEQMIERAAQVGQFPSQRSLYETTELAAAMRVAPSQAREIIDQAIARPATPVYAQISELLQISLHRALTGQQDPRTALAEAARAMRRALQQAGLDRSGP